MSILSGAGKDAGLGAIKEIDDKTIPEIEQAGMHLLAQAINGFGATLQGMQTWANDYPPRIAEALKEVFDAGADLLHGVMDRWDGISVILKVPPRKQ